MRCFIAIPVSGVLAGECAALAAEYPGAVPIGNLHMTLVFLGDCSQQQIQRLIPDLKAVAASCQPFNVRLPCCEPFPCDYGPFLALAGELTAPLKRLREKLVDLSQRQGLELEHRPFRPHITLARPRQTLPPLSINSKLSVDTFWLYESLRGEDGRPIYQSLARFPFSCP